MTRSSSVQILDPIEDEIDDQIDDQIDDEIEVDTAAPPSNLVGLFNPVEEAEESPRDGRTQRRTRNRERVIKSLVELIRAGNPEPTVAEIAEVAGVSHRSVFRYFVDLDDLLRAAVDHELQHALPLGLIQEPGAGSLEQRIDDLVDARLRVYGYTLLTGRVAHSRADSIPGVEQALLSIYKVMRTQTRTQFQQELVSCGIDDAEFRLDAISMLMNFRNYDTHCRIGHTPERIRMVWKTAIDALLAA